MKNKIIQPGNINGTVKAPVSKSMMQRAIAIAVLAQGTSVLHGYTPGNDSNAAIDIAGELGADVVKNGETIIIKGGLNPRSGILNCRESGLCIRMFTPIASLWKSPLTLIGEGSLKTRPVDMLEQPLRNLGVSISSNKGFVPVEVSGPLKGGISNVNGSISSQVLTGLLIATPLAKDDTELLVKDLKSKPYIDMTLQIMQDFGVQVSNFNYELFLIDGNQSYKAREYTVEGDWSGAAFLIVAGALGGSLKIENICTDSAQADKDIIKAVRDAGAIISVEKNCVTVTKKKLKSFEFDATECPDLFPPLVALAVHCEGVSKIKGVSRLKHKESDRAEVLKKEFAKLGTRIENIGDIMHVYGETFSGGKMNSNNDHRIAMAGAVAAISGQEPVEIENPECVAKSYKEFFEDLEKVCNW